MSKIVIVTEAYEKQINGVVTTLYNTKRILEERGHTVILITPTQFKSMPCPTYPEIELVINPWKVSKILKDESPDYIHIATEGPLCAFAVRYCEKNNIPFTTSYHTKLPEYINTRYSFINKHLVYAYLRRLHKNSKTVLVTTMSMLLELESYGFTNLKVWGRGFDRKFFNPDYLRDENIIPILLYVGRISIEKNLEAFLKLETPFIKLVVGDGPLLDEYRTNYPNVKFVGAKKGVELAQYYNNANVFVFPSKTDTFGIVMLEANACGLPIAAFPVTGPIDVVKQNINGYLDENLTVAITQCLSITRSSCIEYSKKFTWEKATDTFFNTLVKID